jgi:CRP-like cAMP-binding protein
MKAQPAVSRLFSLEDWIRGILVAGYIGIVVVCFTTTLGPRIFWTMALPLLIICIVLMGFNTWRRICPLAFWGTFGVRLKPKKAKNRRVPEWMERWFFVISLSFLIVMLVARLVLINGDGPILGFTLIGIAGLAALTNLFFSGRTWCNFICPVGTVERIYTDPNSLRTINNSQCTKCTACKRHCPDIDHENAYWKDVTLPSRRIAFYSFPGVVLGFYSYYYLRAGQWEAYYDGRWTHKLASLDLMFGPGFFFAPFIPALLAALLTLVGFAAISFALFSGIEWLILYQNKDEERARHLTLSLSAFIAFNIFYLYAGAPTLRLIPGGTRVAAFIVPLVSALFLYRRWFRSSEDYVKVKSVKHLLPLWNFKTAPPKDPAEVFAFFKGQEEAHGAQLKAYEEVVRDILADNTVTQKELNLLAQMRVNLSISDAEHKTIFAKLSEEERDRLDPAHAPTVERRLQLQGYKSALTVLLMRQPSADELAVLRLDYGVEPDVHDAVLKELRGESPVLMERIRNRLKRLTRLRLDISALSAFARSSPRIAFVTDILVQAQEPFLRLTLESLRPLSDKNFEADLPKLLSEDAAVRTSAWEHIRSFLKSDLAELISVILQQHTPRPFTGSADLFDNVLKDLSSSTDLYQRAGAALLLGEKMSAPVEVLLRKCLADESDLVQETAIYSATAAVDQIHLSVIETLSKDADQRVRQAAQTILNRRTTTTQSMVLRASMSSFARLSAFEKMLYLHQVPLFADVSVEILDEISRLTKEVEFHEADLLFSQGDVADELYIITDGNAEVLTKRDGAQKTVETLGQGAIIGEMAVIDGHPRSATVRAATPDLRLLRISGADFRRILAHRSDLSTQVMSILSSRLRQALGSL